MLNTRLRTAAKNEFEKDFFKLISYSALGKTMENISKHKGMKPVTSQGKYATHMMKPNFKNEYPF